MKDVKLSASAVSIKSISYRSDKTTRDVKRRSRLQLTRLPTRPDVYSGDPVWCHPTAHATVVFVFFERNVLTYGRCKKGLGQYISSRALHAPLLMNVYFLLFLVICQLYNKLYKLLEARYFKIWPPLITSLYAKFGAIVFSHIQIMTQTPERVWLDLAQVCRRNHKTKVVSIFIACSLHY